MGVLVILPSKGEVCHQEEPVIARRHSKKTAILMDAPVTGVVTS